MPLEMGKFLGFSTATRVAHWNASTVTEEHEALGDLYGSFASLIDTFAEIYLGKKGGKVSFTSSTCPHDDNAALLECGQAEVTHQRSLMKPGVDDDMLNILADMDTAINKARYLLKVSGEPESESKGMGTMMGKLRGMAK
jgi:DNA-binding ferritin-like protein